MASSSLLTWYDLRTLSTARMSSLSPSLVRRTMPAKGSRILPKMAQSVGRGQRVWVVSHASSSSTAEDKGDCLTVIHCYFLNYESHMTLHNEICLQSNNYRTYPVLEMSQCTFAHGKFWKLQGRQTPLQSDTLTSFLDVVAGTVNYLWITIIFHYFVNRILILFDWQYFWKYTIIVYFPASLAAKQNHETNYLPAHAIMTSVIKALRKDCFKWAS